MGGHRVAAVQQGVAQAWKGTLEEGKGRCKCVLRADGAWKRRPVWQQGGEGSQGDVGEAAEKKQLKEVVIKCEAGAFPGSLQLWQKPSPRIVLRQFPATGFHCLSLLEGITPAGALNPIQFISNAQSTTVFTSFLPNETEPGVSPLTPWGSGRLPALAG